MAVVDCSLTTMTAVAIIAACGLSFFFFSVVMDLAETEAVVVVDADAKIEIISANPLECTKKMAGNPRHFQLLYHFVFFFFLG